MCEVENVRLSIQKVTTKLVPLVELNFAAIIGTVLNSDLLRLSVKSTTTRARRKLANGCR